MSATPSHDATGDNSAHSLHRLASCRLCGGKPEKKDEWATNMGHSIFYVRCQNCLIRTNGAFVRSEANAQWNQVMKAANEQAELQDNTNFYWAG